MTRTSLSQPQLQEFSGLLKARESELRKAIHAEMLRSGDKAHVELAGKVQDRGEESVADMLADLQIAELNRETRELADVEAALRRVRDATYGMCIDCGETVAVPRLRAYPAAKRCIDCQERHDNRRGGRDSTPSL
jgi:RNA polymerase-binding protein DksA